jgi:autophagy-related protein 13
VFSLVPWLTIDWPDSESIVWRNADEEDLSAFVNDASQPKPLNRQYRAQNPDPLLVGQIPDRSSRPSSPAAAPYARESPDLGNALGLGLGATGPLLTSEDAVDDQLRRMNATFVASLEMLGSPRRRERARSSPGPGTRDGEHGSWVRLGRAWNESARSRRSRMRVRVRA